VDAVVLATGYCYSFPFLDEGPIGMRFEGLRHVTPQQPHVESAVLVVPQAATPASRDWLSKLLATPHIATSLWLSR